MTFSDALGGVATRVDDGFQEATGDSSAAITRFSRLNSPRASTSTGFSSSSAASRVFRHTEMYPGSTEWAKRSPMAESLSERPAGVAVGCRVRGS